MNDDFEAKKACERIVKYCQKQYPLIGWLNWRTENV